MTPVLSKSISFKECQKIGNYEVEYFLVKILTWLHTLNKKIHVKFPLVQKEIYSRLIFEETRLLMRKWGGKRSFWAFVRNVSARKELINSSHEAEEQYLSKQDYICRQTSSSSFWISMCNTDGQPNPKLAGTQKSNGAKIAPTASCPYWQSLVALCGHLFLSPFNGATQAFSSSCPEWLLSPPLTSLTCEGHPLLHTVCSADKCWASTSADPVLDVAGMP